MVNFEFIEHTADLGIRVKSKELEEIFKKSGEALISIIANIRPGVAKQRKIKVEGIDWPDLLINCLNELLFLFYTGNFIMVSCDISLNEKTGSKILEAGLKGDVFKPSQENIKREVKAATYHNLKIERDEKGRYVAEVIFDV
ncbi:MAG: hypothetical protein GF375_02740 [Candidatus Omnitrophica bacterium]|nr:hypothetical protein [Candidatus Omnitrophota bacterium]MBD3269016.1 hypothetical protein [Candidatus Omnitrophota bacterium]